LKVIPAGEFIIRHGETAEHMFFIVKGSASVISSKGIHLAKFEEGQNFGEMAIFKDGEVRSASVVADTDTSVAVMSSQDFNKICDLFSTFKMIIKEVVQ
jgi:NTE family protein